MKVKKFTFVSVILGLEDLISSKVKWGYITIFFSFNYFLYGRFLLVIHFMHINVYMSIPISQVNTPPHPPPLSPLGVHTFVLYISVSISALQTSSSVPFFLGSTYIC